MADKNRAFPTEINRSFVYLGQFYFIGTWGLQMFLHILRSVPESLP